MGENEKCFRGFTHNSIARNVLLIVYLPELTSMAIDIKNLNHNQLNDLIQKAQARQHELQKESVSRVREKVHALLKAEGVSFEDVFGVGGTVRTKRRGTGSVAPKYRNPADPEQTWSGRGKRPRWFNDALKAGKKEKDLAI